MEVLDQTLISADQRVVRYAGFGHRLLALLIDGIILGCISFAFMYYNIVSIKSSFLLVLVSLVSIAYKPFMEYYYGASLGKMAVKLKVVNSQLDRADLSEIFLRNIFNIAHSVISTAVTLNIFSDPEFQSVTGYAEYGLLAQQYVIMTFVNFLIVLLTIVDAIMLLADKYNRSLHDRIGRTFVIHTA